MKFKELPSQSELLEVFTYNEDEGRFYWNKHPRFKSFSGKIAGSKHCEGGWTITLKNQKYLQCRLVWVYLYGEDPRGLEIDHIDGDRSNDRRENLRLATRKQNQRNVGITKRNTSGHKGVNYYRNGKWRVTIKQKHVGYYESYEDACDAYRQQSEKLYKEFSNVET